MQVQDGSVAVTDDRTPRVVFHIVFCLTSASELADIQRAVPSLEAPGRAPSIPSCAEYCSSDPRRGLLLEHVEVTGEALCVDALVIPQVPSQQFFPHPKVEVVWLGSLHCLRDCSL